MIFASKAFALFLPVVLLAYHLAPGRARKYRVLLLASWAFYAYVPPHYWPVLFALTVLDYSAGLGIGRAATPATRHVWLAASVTANLGLLFAFKYTPFAYDTAGTVALTALGVPLPAADVGHGAGPGHQLPHVPGHQLHRGRAPPADPAGDELRRLRAVRGVLPATGGRPGRPGGGLLAPDGHAAGGHPGAGGRRVSAVRRRAGQETGDRRPPRRRVRPPGVRRPRLGSTGTAHRWAVVGWAVQIYCDFSGYTDMARGCAKLFGFELPENFNGCRTWRPASPTSGGGGTCRCRPGCGTTSTTRWAAAAGRACGRTRTCWCCSCCAACGTGRRGTGSSTACINGVLMCLHRAYDRAVTGVPTLDRVRASAAVGGGGVGGDDVPVPDLPGAGPAGRAGPAGSCDDAVGRRGRGRLAGRGRRRCRRWCRCWWPRAGRATAGGCCPGGRGAAGSGARGGADGRGGGVRGGGGGVRAGGGEDVYLRAVLTATVRRIASPPGGRSETQLGSTRVRTAGPPRRGRSPARLAPPLREGAGG